VVYAKLALGNNTGQPLTSSSFTMPTQASPSELVIYQMTITQGLRAVRLHHVAQPVRQFMTTPTTSSQTTTPARAIPIRKSIYVKSGNKYSFGLADSH